jgi:hypothetical protein
MGNFPKELDSAWRQWQREVGRELTDAEGVAVEEGLFQSWVDQERYDELIRRIHSEYDVEGGEQQIMILGYALRKAKDVARIHLLFQGLVSRRLKSFWSAWRKAEHGHVGSMLLAAQRYAAAMHAYLEYYQSVWSLGLNDECSRIQAEMVALQQRQKLPKKSRSRPTNRSI